MTEGKKYSINQAAKDGIQRLRYPKWTLPEDHLKVDIIDGKTGPWVHLYSPINAEFNGRDPVNILFLNIDCNAVDFLGNYIRDWTRRKAAPTQ